MLPQGNKNIDKAVGIQVSNRALEIAMYHIAIKGMLKYNMVWSFDDINSGKNEAVKEALKIGDMLC